MGGIHRSAPVVGSSEIEIDAAPEAAWEVLTAIGSWPDWNPDRELRHLKAEVEQRR